MDSIVFDTRAFVKELTDAGMPEPQAEVLPRTHATLIDEKLATKLDLKELELRLTFRLGLMMAVAVGAVAVLVNLLSALGPVWAFRKILQGTGPAGTGAPATPPSFQRQRRTRDPRLQRPDDAEAARRPAFQPLRAAMTPADGTYDGETEAAASGLAATRRFQTEDRGGRPATPALPGHWNRTRRPALPRLLRTARARKGHRLRIHIPIAHEVQVGSAGIPGSPPSRDRGPPGSAGPNLSFVRNQEPYCIY